MLWRNQHGWTMSLLSETKGHDKSLYSMSQPTFPVKDTACYFSKYAEYIFIISWFIMTRGSNCKTETCKNEGKKITTTQEELAYPDCILSPMKEQIRR